ncbi:hypothetical protein MMC13_000299 [Lambiella insularis]|nr:hypothetical protein [Lambiella insularis]
MHGYADSGLEVVPGAGPEALYDREHFAPQALHGLQDYPLEVAHSSDPVPAHDPQGYPPEHVPGYDFDKSPLEDKPTKGSDADNEASIKEIEKSDTARRPRSRRKWLWIVAISIILVGIGVGLGVGLTVGRKSSAPASAPGSSSGSGSGLDSGSYSYGVPYVSSAHPAKSSLQANTSLAAVTCDNGDRWVFLQDINGQIRGAQYSSSAGSWSVSSNAYNFAIPAPGTGLAASCSNASALGDGNPGLVISLIYVNTSNSLQESIYDGTKWSDNPIPLQLQPPSNDTKLSISTGLLPSFSDSSSSSDSSNLTVMAEGWSSAAMYENNNSIVLLDLSNIDESASQNISNSFTQFAGLDSQLVTDQEFACMYNGLFPPEFTKIYSQCFFANSTTSPPDGLLWQYNRSSLANNDSIEPTTLKASVQPPAQDSTTTDLSLFLLPNSQLALVSLLANSYITLFTGLVGASLTKGPFVSPAPISATTTHMSATSLLSNSTLIYFYYQANASALAEISFDTESGSWAQEPTFIPVT